jgi:hypothetical protein
MTKGKATGSKKAMNVTPNGSRSVAKRISTLSAKPVVDDVKARIGIAIDTLFENDNVARESFAKHVQKRSEDSKALTQRAHNVFSAFDLSRFSTEVREGPNYLRPTDDLTELQHTVIKDSLKEYKANVNHSMKVVGGEALSALQGSIADGSAVKLNDVLSYVQSKFAGGNVFARQSGFSLCRAELEAKRRLQEVLHSNGTNPSGGSTPQPIPSTEPALDALAVTADTVVKANVSLQMETATSPESYLRYSISDRAKQSDVEKSIATFQLRSGPSDVTSYHDFYNLQIAFQSIWTEMFDGQLGTLGKELYREYVKLKQFSGVDDGVDPAINTVSDLEDLLNSIKEFTKQTAENIPESTYHSTSPVTNSDGTASTFIPVGMGTVVVASAASTNPTPPPGIAYDASGRAIDPPRTGPFSGPLGRPIDEDPLNAGGVTYTTHVASTVGEILGKTSRLYQLLNSLSTLLSEKYVFDVFAKDSINFGILMTYRQKWEPLNYQVGDLVSTIPLAPKEIRRYTTRVVTKKTRAVKEIDNSLQIRKNDSTDTSRVDAEIVSDASNKTNFTITATESLGGGEVPYNISSTQTATQEQSKTSHQVKKDFRESVLKSAQEYRQEHRIEIDTNDAQETETTTYHEIQNPNDELAVTYMFYELQRTYKISEKLHKLTPIILVANDVPSPHEINDAWLLQHDWILRHVILDDSFRPALDYLSRSFVGAEINIRILDSNVRQQRELVERQGQQIQLQNQVLSSALQDVKGAIQTSADKSSQKGIFDTIKSVFDPAGLIKGDPTGVEASQTIVDYTKDTLARSEKEKARLQSQLEVAVAALQVAIDKLSAAIKEHYACISEIDRLRLHVKDNILYYMQAIWNHEPPDQRFFRLHRKNVPMINSNDPKATVGASSATSEARDLSNALLGIKEVGTSLPIPAISITNRKLADVADLNSLLGYKGNYMMFPLTENNYLTLHMMQDYLEVGDEITVRDPDEFSNHTLDELQEFATCLYEHDREAFNEHKNQFKKIMIDRLTSTRKDSELVIVPTKSLFIEALVGTHPLLEDFKLIHRALDVKKVQAEVRHAELENIRLASRVLKGKDEDPDIEKKIIIEGNDKGIVVQPDE